MRSLLITLTAITAITMMAQAVQAGNCRHDDDTASDGSRCGARSADSRPGGAYR